MASRAKASTRVSMPATLDDTSSGTRASSTSTAPAATRAVAGRAAAAGASVAVLTRAPHPPGDHPGGPRTPRPAQHAGGPQQQDHGHGPEDQEAGVLGQQRHPQHLDLADDHGPEEGAGDRPEPAEDDHHQPQDQHPLVEAGIGAEDRCPQHPAQAGQHHPEGEHGHHQPPGVDPEGPDHGGVGDRRPDQRPGPAPLHQQPDEHGQGQPGDDHRQPVAGVLAPGDADAAGQERRRRDRLDVVAEPGRQQVADDQGHPEGEQRLVEVAPPGQRPGQDGQPGAGGRAHGDRGQPGEPGTRRCRPGRRRRTGRPGRRRPGTAPRGPG